MPSRFGTGVSVIALMAASNLTQIASAADLTWNDSGPSDEWNTTDSNWNNGASAFTNGDSVIFSGAGETVSLDSTVETNSITFGSSGYTISNTGSGQIKNVSGGTTVINSTSGSNTINVPLSGSISAIGSGSLIVLGGSATSDTTLSKVGTGTLTLDGASWNSTAEVSVFEGILDIQESVNAAKIQVGGNAGIAATLKTSVHDLLSDTVTVDVDTANAVWELGASDQIGQIEGMGEINLGGNNLIVSSAARSDFEGKLTGTGVFIKEGSGIVNLTGAGTFTGFVEVNGGYLILNSTLPAQDFTVISGQLTTFGAPVFNTTTTVDVQTNGTFVVENHDQTIRSLTGDGTVKLKGSVLTIDNTTHDIFSGTIERDGGLLKQGSGHFTLSGANTYTGGTEVADGTLRLENNAAAGTGTITTTGSVIDYANGVTISNAINVNSNTTQLEVSTGTATQSGVISETSGPRPVEKIGSGTLVLSGSNTYTGATTVSGGTLDVTGSLSGDVSVGSGATLQVDGASIVDTATVTVNSGGTMNLTGSETIGSLTGAGTVGLNANTLTTGDAGNDTFSGIISGSGGLSKQGAGTLTMSGANTYTGTTTVSGGTLDVTGSLAGDVSVDSGATLQVDGTSIVDTATVTVNSGGTMNLTGSETIGALTGAGTVGLNANTLTTGDAGNDTFSGIISGSGGLSKQGAGTLTLSGANTYTGTAFVIEGGLEVTGSLTGSAEFDTGTTAFGTGTFGDLLIKSGATLRPGTAAGSIANLNTGNLTLAAGSTFEIDVNENGDSVGNRDQLNVTGTVTLGGSNLNILGAAGTYAGTPIDYTIISNDGADAVTGTFDTITDDLAFLEASVDYTGGDGNDVILTLSDSVKLSELGGTNPNQSSVGGALENVDTTPGSAGETLINKIKGLTSGQAQKTYQDLAGDVHTSNMQNLMNVGGNVGGQVGGRIANITSGGVGADGNGFGYTAALETINANSSNQYFSTELAVRNGEEIGYGYTPANADELQVWGGISGYYANVEGDGNAQGTLSSGFGAVLGGDRTAGYSTWGAALGYSKTTTSSHDSLSELGMNSFSGALYTLQELGGFNINGLGAYTYHKIDGKRSISNINATALSDYHAHQVTLQGEISRTYAFDYNKDISPFLLGRYMHVSTSAYTETGAGAANLVSAGENYWSLDLVLGARMDIEINARTKVTFGAGYAHRFGDASPDANYIFSGGGTFTTQGVARNRHSAFLEAGFEKAFSDTSTFFAKANAELTDTHQSIGGNIGFKVRF